MQKKHSLLLVGILKWTVVFLIFANIAALITLPWWLDAIYTGGYTALLSGGYFDTTITSYVRGDFPLMLRFLAICGLFSLLALIFAFRILLRLSHSEPFHEKNARDLRIMALAAFGIICAGIYKICYQITLYSLLFIGVFALACLFLLILAQIFDEARRIKSENDLVI